MTPFFDIWDQAVQNRHVKKVIGTNITALYSALTIAYFFTQVLVLISALDANRAAGTSLEKMLNMAHVSTSDDFSFLDSNANLRVCHGGISKSSPIEQCQVVFPIANNRTPVPASAENSVIASQYIKRDDDDFTLVPVFDDSNLTGFMVLNPERPGEIISLAPVCLQALDWPYQHLIQNRRVDVTVACFQVWLLVVSVFALFNQSFSSVIAAAVMHLLALVLSSAQTLDMVAFKSDYVRLITSSTGACSGFDMLATFFTTRLTYAIAMTVVNAVALIISGYLTWRLLTPYGFEMLKDEGASLQVRTAWFTAQALYSVVQLTPFLFVASVGIWLDEITKHIMGARPALLPMCLVFYILSAVLVVPWLSLAILAILRESTRLMIAFFVLSGVYLVGCGVMFVSTTFRQTFINWPFFAAMFSLSYIFIVATVVLAARCRMNFGTLVMQYLRLSKDEDASRKYTDEKGNLRRLTLADRGQFVVTLPDQNRLENLPKRWASLSSTYSSKSARSIGSGKLPSPPLPVAAAQPGAIKVAPPRSATTNTITTTPTTLSPANSVSSKTKSTWKQGDRPFWGRSNKRHESAMSFGHMDPSRLTISSSPEMTRNLASVVQPSLDARNTPRTDSVGSIYSTQPKKTRLFLVTDL